MRTTDPRGAGIAKQPCPGSMPEPRPARAPAPGGDGAPGACGGLPRLRDPDAGGLPHGRGGAGAVRARA